MAYADFSLRDATKSFGLSIQEHPDLFAAVPELQPSEMLAMVLHEYIPLARMINTEKARSEWMIAPVLADVRMQLKHRIGLFSGVEFNVDPARGLKGYCDYIITGSPVQSILTAPIMVVVEAKNVDLRGGVGQCVAEMVAAQAFNEKDGRKVESIHGAVSTGDQWIFVKLVALVVMIDEAIYPIDRLPKILGILASVARGECK